MKFNCVSEGIFRGSQPYTEHDYDCLSTFRTIIKLNKQCAADEYMFCKQRNINYERHLFSEWKRPPAKCLRHIVHVITTMPKPVYIHCLHGCDRTGYVIAAYRMLIEKWTFRQAWQELIEHGHKTYWPPYWFWRKSLEEIFPSLEKRG